MAGILAYDLNAMTGWAFWEPGRSVPLIGVENLAPDGPVGRDLGPVLLRLEKIILDHRAVFQPEVIYFEAPVETGNRPTTNAQMHFSYPGVVELSAARELPRRARCWQAHVDKVRTHVIGQARPTKANPLKGKALALQYVMRRGWDYKDDNGADAAVLLVYAGSCEGVRI